MANNILYCATVDYHFKAFHLPYMRWFKEQGWKVDVAASGDINLPYTDNKYNLPIERSPLSKSNIKAYKQLKEIIDQNNYSIIHCHTPLGGVLARLAARQARQNGTKVIYTAHGFHFCQGAPVMNWLLYYPIEKYLSRHTDSLITINNEDYNLATKRRFKAGEIKLVQGVGVNTEQFKPVHQNIIRERKKSFGYHADDFLLFNAAEFNKNKNQQFLIYSLALIKDELPNAKLLLAGEGHLLESCQELAKRLGVSHMVDFLGFRKDIAEIISICDTAVASSFREGLPVNVMEAMACGLPVVAVDNRGHRDLIVNNENGFLLTKWDPQVFANKINKLATDPALRKRMGDNGRKKLVEKFNVVEILSKKSDIYRSYMGNGGDSVGNPLRVLHVVVNMNRGGAETLIMNLYRNMDRRKVQFDFLTCKKGSFDDEIIQLGGKVHRMPYVTDVGHLTFIREVKLFLLCNPNYKIVHSHMDKMSGFVLRAAKKAKVPIRIAHSHNTESEGGVLAKTYKWYAGSHVKNAATHLYACSNKAASWLFGNQSEQALILNNGIEIEKLTFSESIRKVIRNELQIEKDTIVIGHVGRFSNQKNHLFLLEVFAKINKQQPNTVLLLAGDGPLRQKIALKIKELQIERKVKLLGVREDIPHLLQAFDVFTFPSIHEGLPVTLIEAQGAGLPCVISDNITNEVDMGIGLIDYLPISDKQAWIDGVLHTVKSTPSRDILRGALAKKGYDIRKTAKQTQLSYESLWEEVI